MEKLRSENGERFIRIIFELEKRKKKMQLEKSVRVKCWEGGNKQLTPQVASFFRGMLRAR